MEKVVTMPLFWVFLCIVSFQVGVWVHKKTQIAVFNPLLVAIIIVITIIQLLGVPLEVFKEGTQGISMLLGPATVLLALPIYRQRRLLRENIVPVVVSTAVGAITSIISVIGLSLVFGLDETIMYSLIPKSVTTPIAMEVSGQLGGIVGVTVTAVVITGITGAVIAPNVLKLFRIKNDVAVGVAIGTASHAVGTAKAVQLGEIQGAMSGIAIGMAGIFTVLLSLFV
ncbi:MAG: LrgB family protein [Cellulosilyticaceae bacterium]